MCVFVCVFVCFLCVWCVFCVCVFFWVFLGGFFFFFLGGGVVLVDLLSLVGRL